MSEPSGPREQTDPPEQVGPPEPVGPTEQWAPTTPHRRTAFGVLIAIVAALVLVAAAAFAVVLGGEDDVADPTTDPEAGDLAEVEIYEDLSTEHVSSEVTYPQAPPVGGEHDEAWHDCGVYDEPVREENMVHSLEHGTVWVTYRPGFSEDEIDGIVALLPDDAIVSPYPDQEAPVVVTVWERQLALDGPDDPRLELFVAEYGDGHTSPEPLVTCAGGIVVGEDDSAGTAT